MPYYLLFSFATGVVFALLLVRGGPTLRQKRVVTQLKADKATLTKRKDDLAKIISQNQEAIRTLQNKIEFLQTVTEEHSEILSSVTRIREQFEITPTKQFRKKYEKTLSNDTYISE